MKNVVSIRLAVVITASINNAVSHSGVVLLIDNMHRIRDHEDVEWNDSQRSTVEATVRAVRSVKRPILGHEEDRSQDSHCHEVAIESTRSGNETDKSKESDKNCTLKPKANFGSTLQKDIGSCSRIQERCEHLQSQERNNKNAREWTHLESN